MSTDFRRRGRPRDRAAAGTGRAVARPVLAQVVPGLSAQWASSAQHPVSMHQSAVDRKLSASARPRFVPRDSPGRPIGSRRSATARKWGRDGPGCRRPHQPRRGGRHRTGRALQERVAISDRLVGHQRTIHQPQHGIDHIDMRRADHWLGGVEVEQAGNTENRRNVVLSSSSRRSFDQDTIANSVRCPSCARREPRTGGGTLVEWRRSPSEPSTDRAAASRWRAVPSSCRQISTIAARFSMDPEPVTAARAR